MTSGGFATDNVEMAVMELLQAVAWGKADTSVQHRVQQLVRGRARFIRQDVNVVDGEVALFCCVPGIMSMHKIDQDRVWR